MTEANRTENPNAGFHLDTCKLKYGGTHCTCGYSEPDPQSGEPLSSNLVHDLRAAADNCSDYGGTLREAAEYIDVSNEEARCAETEIERLQLTLKQSVSDHAHADRLFEENERLTQKCADLEADYLRRHREYMDYRYGGEGLPQGAEMQIEQLRLALGRAAFRWRYAATNWGLPQRAIDECLQYAEDCAQGAAVETTAQPYPFHVSESDA